ncbi:hypothetical protein D9611_014776 [Ephemerocybe angulata]|uniref:Tc1-like transposase DDE domain-containing protein n=1 Tax=Ephemerocybe angulata TaxID=980116 RepID=A0A8H5CA28_9AGAR|nr:hypothetical protein D9611_014776 [Tulosesus angulatus]
MPYRPISADVKWAAIRLYDRNLLELPDILDCLKLSRRTFFRVRRCLLETGDVVRHSTGLRGRPRQFQFEDIDYLLRVIKHRPDWFLDELQMLLQTNRFVAVHFTTIYRALERARVSRKKLKKIAAERDEEKRANFIRRMAQYTPEQLGFLDEVSKDERTGSRRFGRAGLGARAVKKGVFIRGRRFSAEGLLTIDGMVSNTVVEGSLTKRGFLNYLEHSVLPLCTPFPGTLSVLVMDNGHNARIHQGPEIAELLEEHGVRLEYLPPYSPDLNPIEEAFSKIKAFIRRHAGLMAKEGDGDTPGGEN